jgi:Uma2 family endonuclease
MPTAVRSTTWTAEELGNRFGTMPLWRIRFNPMPGDATEQDVLDVLAKEGKLCELVDGVLVEKVMGMRESCLASMLIHLMRTFLNGLKLGTVSAPDGLMRLATGLVRIPDVAFISWDKFPERRLPAEPIPDLAPDLAVEVLSRSNTEQEMTRKLTDYFNSSVRLVWFVDPDTRTVEVYTSPDQSVVLHEDQTLDGGDVLPGFTLPLRELFAELDTQSPATP